MTLTVSFLFLTEQESSGFGGVKKLGQHGKHPLTLENGQSDPVASVVTRILWFSVFHELHPPMSEQHFRAEGLLPEERAPPGREQQDQRGAHGRQGSPLIHCPTCQKPRGLWNPRSTLWMSSRPFIVALFDFLHLYVSVLWPKTTRTENGALDRFYQEFSCCIRETKTLLLNAYKISWSFFYISFQKI